MSRDCFVTLLRNTKKWLFYFSCTEPPLFVRPSLATTLLNVCNGVTIDDCIIKYCRRTFSCNITCNQSCLIILTLPCLCKKMYLFDFFSFHNAELLILIGYLKFKTKIITIFNFTWGKPDILTVMPQARGKTDM